MSSTRRRAPLTEAALRYRHAWLAAAWLQVALLIVLGLLPAGGGLNLPVSDKVLHFLQFFVVMAWFGGVYTGARQWIAAAALFALGTGIELAQGLSLFREFDLADLIANLVGLVAGLIAVRTVLRGWCARIEAALA